MESVYDDPDLTSVVVLRHANGARTETRGVTSIESDYVDELDGSATASLNILVRTPAETSPVVTIEVYGAEAGAVTVYTRLRSEPLAGAIGSAIGQTSTRYRVRQTGEPPARDFSGSDFSRADFA